MREYLSDRVKHFMKIKDKTWYSLAKESGVSEQALSKFNHLQSTPEIYTIKKLCVALDVTMGQFFSESDEYLDLSEDEKFILDAYREMNDDNKEMLKRFLKSMKTE